MAASRLTLTPSPRGEADAEHRLLGEAVEEGAEGEGRAGAAARRAPLDEAVEPEVGERADGETASHRGAAADLQALLGEVEADRAHEGAGAEGEHDAHGAVRPRAGQAQQRADDERGRGERAPAQRRCHGMMGAGCGRSERAARTSARGVRAPDSRASRASEIATPTSVSAAGHTTASDASAPRSSAMPGGERQRDEQRSADGRQAGARERHRGARALREDRGDDDGGGHRQSEGEQEARRRAEPQHARACLEGQHVARAVPAACAARPAPRPTSRTVRRTRAERASEHAPPPPPRAAAAASSATGGAWRLPTPSATAASSIARPETLSNEASAQSVPASAGQVASRSSRLASVTRTASPPRGGEHAAEAGAADVPRAHAPARDLGPRRREHAAPGDAPRDLPAHVEDDGKHQPPDLGAGGSEHGANHSPPAVSSVSRPGPPRPARAPRVRSRARRCGRSRG